MSQDDRPRFPPSSSNRPSPMSSYRPHASISRSSYESYQPWKADDYEIGRGDYYNRTASSDYHRNVESRNNNYRSRQPPSNSVRPSLMSRYKPSPSPNRTLHEPYPHWKAEEGDSDRREFHGRSIVSDNYRSSQYRPHDSRPRYPSASSGRPSLLSSYKSSAPSLHRQSHDLFEHWNADQYVAEKAESSYRPDGVAYPSNYDLPHHDQRHSDRHHPPPPPTHHSSEWNYHNSHSNYSSQSSHSNHPTQSSHSAQFNHPTTSSQLQWNRQRHSSPFEDSSFHGSHQPFPSNHSNSRAQYEREGDGSRFKNEFESSSLPAKSMFEPHGARGGTELADGRRNVGSNFRAESVRQESNKMSAARPPAAVASTIKMEANTKYGESNFTRWSPRQEAPESLKMSSAHSKQFPVSTSPTTSLRPNPGECQPASAAASNSSKSPSLSPIHSSLRCSIEEEDEEEEDEEVNGGGDSVQSDEMCKEEITRQMDKIDDEIAKLEDLISGLSKNSSLEESYRHPLDALELAQSSESTANLHASCRDNLLEKTARRMSLWKAATDSHLSLTISKIVKDNRGRVKDAHSFIGSQITSGRVYKSPEDYPIFSTNRVTFSLIRPALVRRIHQRGTRTLERISELQQTYESLYVKWRAKLYKYEQVKMDKPDWIRSTPRTRTIHGTKSLDYRYLKNVATIPPMRLGTQPLPIYKNTNALFNDSLSAIRHANSMNPWRPLEQQHFASRFQMYGKQFGHVVSGLNRSVAEAVLFYYLTKRAWKKKRRGGRNSRSFVEGDQPWGSHEALVASTSRKAEDSALSGSVRSTFIESSGAAPPKSPFSTSTPTNSSSPAISPFPSPPLPSEHAFDFLQAEANIMAKVSWTNEEIQLAKESFFLVGRDCVKVAEVLGTKTILQCWEFYKTHIHLRGRHTSKGRVSSEALKHFKSRGASGSGTGGAGKKMEAVEDGEGGGGGSLLLLSVESQRSNDDEAFAGVGCEKNENLFVSTSQPFPSIGDTTTTTSTLSFSSFKKTKRGRPKREQQQLNSAATACALLPPPLSSQSEPMSLGSFDNLQLRRSINDTSANPSLNFLDDKERKRTVSYWTAREKLEFTKYFNQTGKQWRELAALIGTKSEVQIRNYYQNHKHSLESKKQTLESKKRALESQTQSHEPLKLSQESGDVILQSPSSSSYSNPSAQTIGAHHPPLKSVHSPTPPSPSTKISSISGIQPSHHQSNLHSNHHHLHLAIPHHPFIPNINVLLGQSNGAHATEEDGVNLGSRMLFSPLTFPIPPFTNLIPPYLPNSNLVHQQNSHLLASVDSNSSITPSHHSHPHQQFFPYYMNEKKVLPKMKPFVSGFGVGGASLTGNSSSTTTITTLPSTPPPAQSPSSSSGLDTLTRYALARSQPSKIKDASRAGIKFSVDPAATDTKTDISHSNSSAQPSSDSTSTPSSGDASIITTSSPGQASTAAATASSDNKII